MKPVALGLSFEKSRSTMPIDRRKCDSALSLKTRTTLLVMTIAMLSLGLQDQPGAD